MYRQSIENDDHTPAATAAGSVEPMRRADHKAKKHGRPVRYVRPVKRECGE
jgi:hypothetical protein